jgi:AcrR family transcriptional regulator
MRFTIHSPQHKPYDEGAGTLKVVRAAKSVFLRFGGAKFSIRGVAREAKMSMGAVQHFYPTRDQLVAAMLEYVTNDYETEWERVSRDFPFNGEDRLMHAIEYLAADILHQETRQFFFALWSLSCHNKFAATLQEEMYAQHVRNMATFIGAAKPEFSERQCVEAAMQIVALIEGLMLFTAPGTRHLSSRASLVRLLTRTVKKLLLSDEAADLSADTTNGRHGERTANQ